MPRQFGQLDQSIGWPQLPCCPHRHPVSAPCPPSETWLVLHFCPACNETTGLYCRTHRDRHMPSGDTHHTVAEPTPDVQQLRAGENGGDA